MLDAVTGTCPGVGMTSYRPSAARRFSTALTHYCGVLPYVAVGNHARCVLERSPRLLDEMRGGTS
jgi:hypothetical protein